MPDIQQLPPSVINKIAAGEVIERPASLVKELLENSVDAQSKRIDVTLEQGGTAMVRVADDGSGICAEQLPLATASHATSKIRCAEDLFKVGTLGFRGEALASIAEVSHLRIRSRPSGDAAGAEWEVRGGAAVNAVGDCAASPAPCACAVGTTIEVRNLFFNTPVRKRFLRTTQTEMGHCSETFTRLALSHPSIHFTLRHNERVLHDLPPVENWRQRIAAFYGAELADALIPIESRDLDVRLSGYVADPNFSRSHNRMQYLFLNGRYIRDRALGHALGEGYRGLLLSGRYPIAFLRLDLPADAVDVNVHPTKLEVRFQEGGRLYSQLLGALRTKFLSTDLTSRIHTSSDDSTGDADVGSPGAQAGEMNDDDPSRNYDPARLDKQRRELVEWAKGQLPGDQQEANGKKDSTDNVQHAGQYTDENTDQNTPRYSQQGDLDLHYEQSPRRLELNRLNLNGQPSQNTAGASGSSIPNGAKAPSSSSTRAVQLHDRYLVTENDEGMVVIDQHALHERILYEHLREKVLQGAMETQRLLAPEPVALSPQEAAAALEARDLLAEMGVEIEAFGGDTVVIRGYPAMLANLDPAELLRQVVDRLTADGKPPSRRDLLDDLLHMISCKAAIKAGDRLSAEEVTALLEQRHLCQDSHHCPHGRPTSLVFTRAELDRRFKRT